MSKEEIKRMEDFVNATLKPDKPNEYRLGWEDGVRKCYYLVDDLQQRIDKTIEYIKIVIEIIKEQPTGNDEWILEKLNGFLEILGDKE